MMWVPQVSLKSRDLGKTHTMDEGAVGSKSGNNIARECLDDFRRPASPSIPFGVTVCRGCLRPGSKALRGKNLPKNIVLGRRWVDNNQKNEIGLVLIACQLDRPMLRELS